MNSRKMPLARMHEKDDPMNNFFMLAHDIKAPINQIKKLLTLAMSARNDAETRQILELAFNSSETLSRKVQEILNLVRGEHQKTVRIDFQALFESIKSSLKEVDGFSSTKFICTIDENINFQGNPVKIHSIMQNLIENAIKYRKNHGHENIIILTVHEAQEYLIVKLTDNGRGIRSHDLTRIFDKTYQVNENDPGNGMGLYLVKKNLNEMGAAIRVESTEGEGTTFTIELPITSEDRIDERLSDYEMQSVGN